ncbi:aromatic amino acid aminotransferase-like protein [Apodospora peruviana]|uniref:aromatic-amino-acid transaminase n=1 Tax=Apodospora peruviana TaxID=516989 RepID=A0AAE0IPC4_9PEZI|nr:aromatic amino acid aminotransferase-like protein [Apodospora peruviana]
MSHYAVPAYKRCGLPRMRRAAAAAVVGPSSGATSAAVFRGRQHSRLLISPHGQQHSRARTNSRLFHSNSRLHSEALASQTVTKAAKVVNKEEDEITIELESYPADEGNGVTFGVGRPNIGDIMDRRAKAGRLVAMTAAYSDSDMFKAPAPEKPLAKRWDHHVSAESTIRGPCVLKQAAKHLKKPGIISLGGGLPCPEYFPFESITLKVPKPPNFSEAATLASGETVTIGKYDVSSSTDKVYDLSIALNYGQATGSAQMMRFVTEHTELTQNPPYADWRCCLTVGSTGALEQALRMLFDRQRGDSLLTEEYSFSTALETAVPLGVNVVGVKMDDQGLLPGSMDEILGTWNPEQQNGKRKPHVLYTVPSGQNPTGATQGTKRRKEIYGVCQKHDVFIIEDEPYYFLQMPAYGSDTLKGSVDEFLDTLIPSLLSMDTDGRVLRMDSFSKVVVPGSRLGWITASAQMVERYIRHAEVASQGPSGFSQVILHKLLDEEWGHEGYLRWLMNLRDEYAKRRDVMISACESLLPKEVVSWAVPMAGMFHWIKVNPRMHPDFPQKSLLQIEEEIFHLCLDKGALVARGSWFRAEPKTTPNEETDYMYFRTTFAAATPENMTEAIRRFGEAVRESFRI